MLDKDLDSLEQEFALEHKRFLEQHNPSVLRGQSDPDSYLSSVGRAAGERWEHLMSHYLRDKDLQKLPAPQRALALRSRQHSVEEVIRHDLIFQPLPEGHDRPYEGQE
jgi:hypothetical protein